MEDTYNTPKSQLKFRDYCRRRDRKIIKARDSECLKKQCHRNGHSRQIRCMHEFTEGQSKLMSGNIPIFREEVGLNSFA